MPQHSCTAVIAVTPECDTRVWHQSVTPDCDTRVWHQSVTPECDTRVWHQSVTPECDTRVTPECDTRVWHQSVTPECDTRVWHQSVTPECDRMMRRHHASHTSPSSRLHITPTRRPLAYHKPLLNREQSLRTHVLLVQDISDCRQPVVTNQAMPTVAVDTRLDNRWAVQPHRHPRLQLHDNDPALDERSPGASHTASVHSTQTALQPTPGIKW